MPLRCWSLTGVMGISLTSVNRYPSGSVAAGVCAAAAKAVQNARAVSRNFFIACAVWVLVFGYFFEEETIFRHSSSVSVSGLAPFGRR